MSVKLGWKAGAEQYPPADLLDYAIAAEDAGFESIDVSDHFHPWAEVGSASFAWTWLGAAAARTTRIALGTGITCPIIRYHPAIIAQAISTLDELAPGRTFLGVGTGEALNEYAATGKWPGYAGRQARLAEAIELIRSLWTGEEVTFTGKYYETKKARLYTRSNRPIPLLVSTLVPDSAAFAGKHGDGLITVGGKSPDHYREMIARFQAGARAAGKDPEEMTLAIELNVAYTEDTDAAVQEMRAFWAGTFVPALFDQKIYSPHMSEENGQAVGADTIKKQVCISANPDDHTLFAQQFIDLGFNQLFFHSAGPDQTAFINDYGRDVLPRLKQIQSRAA